MQEILFGYKLNPTTWAYISALMMIGVYFKFHRFWSVRNLDLVAMVAFSPGFLFIYHGLLRDRSEMILTGYIWLFVAGGFFLVRLLLDPIMVRRPLLEPNLSASGLMFTGVALLVFLMTNVITCPKERLEYELAKQKTSAAPGAGYAPFYKFSNIANAEMVAIESSQPDPRRDLRVAAVHAVAILAHLIVVAGMVWIGYRHFDNIHTGAAAATLYLLMFYTSQFTSQTDHVLPAALLVWGVAAYRRPMVAGVLIGLAAGLIYYPLFLLPLWCGFYWRRGMVRFLLGVILALAALTAILLFLAPDFVAFAADVKRMFGWCNPFTAKLSGFWQYCPENDQAYRMPVLTAFAVSCAGMALWPAHKNLGTLLSCSAAVMLATQFWHAHQGGLFMAWYLPLLILTVFRPNLEDRVALSAVRPAWGRRKKSQQTG